MVALQYTETKYLLKVSEAANMLGLSVHTVYRLIEQGWTIVNKVDRRREKNQKSSSN